MSFELHSTPLAGDRPDRWLLATHGIFGSGSNLRTVCKKIVAARPRWGVLLVDLPGHGRSRPWPSPHDIQAAAEQLAGLVKNERDAGRRVTALLGHSLGGKVVALARSMVPELAQSWILDSSPSSKPDAFDPPRQVPRVLAMLESLPPRFEGRDEFVAAVEERGYPRALAQWLAMSLDRDGESFRFGLDLAVMRELLDSYYRTDVWAQIESPAGGALEVVIATASQSLDDSDRSRLRELAERGEHLRVHEIDSGHWLHVERPQELVALVADNLPAA